MCKALTRPIDNLWGQGKGGLQEKRRKIQILNVISLQTSPVTPLKTVSSPPTASTVCVCVCERTRVHPPMLGEDASGKRGSRGFILFLREVEPVVHVGTRVKGHSPRR